MVLLFTFTLNSFTVGLPSVLALICLGLLLRRVMLAPRELEFPLQVVPVGQPQPC